MLGGLIPLNNNVLWSTDVATDKESSILCFSDLKGISFPVGSQEDQI